MALFKARNNRRSSSPSYVSTLITLAFIALCVFGVWMLNSNSGWSPLTQTEEEDPTTTTRTAIDTSETETTNNDLSISNDSHETATKNTEESIATAITAKSEEQKDTSTTTTPVFGDNPGHLPDDAIKSDDKNPNNEQHKHHSVISDSQISEESSLTQKEQATVIQETSSDTDQNTSEPEKQKKKEEEDSGKTLEDVPSFDTPKIVEDEANKEQLREDKGENIVKDENVKTNQDDSESLNSKLGTSKAKSSKTMESSKKKGKDEEDTGKTQEDVPGFDTPKNVEDEANKEQLREDKGENIEKDEKVKTNQDDSDNSNSKVGISKAKSSKNMESSKKKGKKTEDEKTDKKGKKSKKSWSTQADQSQNENTKQKDESEGSEGNTNEHKWYLCNVTAGADYIPCLDNEKAIKMLRSTKHFEHRERHCPEEAPTCLVPIPKGYKTRIQWPNSRDKIWYHNVPHIKLAEVKGHQNWVKVTGEFLTFPGGGTQFIHGALHYIDFLQTAESGIAWGKRTRVILDVGCGVGSFGGYLFDRDVVAMSFAPKDEHEAQVQFALERGIPAISAVMGSQRLPFPSDVFDLVHCARCRVPWHVEGGKLLLELNRVLRPGGYFVWSATPVYQKLEEDVEIWKEMSSLTKAMCWELLTINKDELNKVGAAIYRKPTSNECYEQREKNQPPMCTDDDDPNAAWYVPLQACMHKVPVNKAERGTKWPEAWPRRLHKAPYWLNSSEVGIYGKPAPQDFAADTERWKGVVDELTSIGISWSNVRNVMDMRAVYGGFAAALKDLPVWVFNVVNVDAPDTLPIIYERGLFGIYHDWCESFSTYPRTFDLLHADKLFSKLKERCKLIPIIAEVDRITRPGGTLIVRDEPSTISEVEALLKSLHWEIINTKEQEGMICAKRGNWRPNSVASS